MWWVYPSVWQFQHGFQFRTTCTWCSPSCNRHEKWWFYCSIHNTLISKRFDYRYVQMLRGREMEATDSNSQTATYVHVYVYIINHWAGTRSEVNRLFIFCSGFLYSVCGVTYRGLSCCRKEREHHNYRITPVPVFSYNTSHYGRQPKISVHIMIWPCNTEN